MTPSSALRDERIVHLDRERHPEGQSPAEQVARYYPAIRAYLRAILRDEDALEDELHNIVVKILGGALAGWDPSQGQFCDFLKTIVRNAARDSLRRKKTRANYLDNLAAALNGPPDPPGSVWWVVYRQGILSAALAALRAYQDSHPGNVFATTIEALSEGTGAEDSDQFASLLGHIHGQPLTGPNVRKIKERARRKFAELLIDVVRASLDDPTPRRIAAELSYLGLTPFVEMPHRSEK